jgi:proline dehydrogenase
MKRDLEQALEGEGRSMEDAWAASTSFLRAIAVNPDDRELIRRSPVLLKSLEAAARPYVAGWDRATALETARELAASSIRVSVDFMGEDTVDRSEIEEATVEFVDLINSCHAIDEEASVSVNLSHIGLAVESALARDNCERLAEAAEIADVELIINMEGDRYRENILETFWTLGTRYADLGITLQACLERTTDDLTRSLAVQGRIRLVKGAYDELGEGAIRGVSVNERFSELADRLIGSGHKCAIATHDPELLTDAVDRMDDENLSHVEFEMLHGVARHRLEALRDQGYAVRVYLPYGTDWLLYLFHRLAEYPPNLHFAVQAAGSEALRLLRAKFHQDTR